MIVTLFIKDAPTIFPHPHLLWKKRVILIPPFNLQLDVPHHTFPSVYSITIFMHF